MELLFAVADMQITKRQTNYDYFSSIRCVVINDQTFLISAARGNIQQVW